MRSEILFASFVPAIGLFFKNHPGILFVLIGVAGEVICEWNKEKGLRGLLARIFGLILISGLLMEIWEATKTDKDVASLRVAAGEANRAAAQANERAAKFDADRVLVEKEAEEIRSTNFVLQARVLELESKQLPRHLLPEQSARIADKLRQFQGTPMNFITYPEDKESLDFANDVLRTLSSSGWKYQPDKQWSGLMGVVSGVIVDASDNSTPALKKAAAALVSALQTEGVSVRLGNDNADTNRIMVTVGKKP